jgi:hypothetical protein
VTGYLASDARGHRWIWRRRRNQDFGYWEDMDDDGRRVGPVGLTDQGYAALTPDEAVEAQEMLGGEGE